MTEEDVVSIPAPPQVDLKRKHDDVEPEQHDGSDNNSNGDIVDDNNNAVSDSSQAKRPKLEDDLDNVKTQVNGSSMEIKEEEETEIQDAVVEQVEDPIHTDGVDQSADELVNPEDKQQSCIEEINVEECKDVNGGGSSKEEIGKENKEVEVDDTQSTSRMINVPSSKVGVLIGKGGETIRNLQFNSGAKIQILKDSEADPNSALRPVEIIGNVLCIDNAEKLINAVIAEAEAGGSPALVARGHPAIHSMGTPKQIEIKVPNDKVGLIIGRGGETIKNMQTRSGARIQLIPQHPEGDNSQERTVRISGDKKQIDIATDMIKDVMYQNARPSPYSGGYNQPAYRPRGPGGPPQWGSRGPYAPHSMPYDYHRGPYSSQGSHYHSPGYGVYPPQHMPPRGGYGAGWDQRPPHSGPYDYYGRQGTQTSGPVPPPSGRAPSPALGGPPPSQVSYGYGQSHGPEYGNAASYSQTGHQQTYGQPPYGGSYTSTGGGQPGYSQMQQPGGRPYVVQQGPVQQGYGPPRPVAAASSGDVPYQGATPAAAAAPSYGSTNMAPQQQYGYTSSGGPVQQQTYPSYSSAPPSDSYNNSTQTPATGPAYQQQSVQPASSTHDQPGAQQATAAGYGGQVAQTGGYSSYPSSQPSYGTGQTQNYGYNTSSQDPSYGYGAAPGGQPTYSQAAPGSQLAYSQAAPGSQPAYSQAAGYEQQTATQPAGYVAAPGSAQVKTQSPQSAYAQYDASQVYAAPR